MITYGFLACVAACAALAMTNWRLGCFLWLAVAILQDPVRKVTTGTPAFLTLAFLPVYFGAFYGAINEQHGVSAFVRTFPRLFARFQIFMIAIACSFAVAVGLTGQSPVGAGLGVMSYAGGVPAILLGYWYLKGGYRDLEPLLMGFVAITSVMLVGVPLEQWGVKFSKPWLGTIASDQVWYRWFNDNDYVAMLSGFHRSPEIMGWHAMALTLISFYLVLRRPRYAWLWGLTATWGVYAVFMSGRRKMLMMMVAYLVALFWASSLQNRRKIMSYMVIGMIFLSFVMLKSVDSLYMKSLDSGLSVATDKLSEKGFRGPLWLMGIVGPFGYGVGTLTQGAQHLGQTQGIPLVEGGLEKVMVELGIVGLICTGLFAFEVLGTSVRTIRESAHRSPGDFGPPFCFAFVAANLVAFLIAFQFLGDPFIGSFVGFLMGLLLSYRRLPRPTPPAVQAVPVGENFRQSLHYR